MAKVFALRRSTGQPEAIDTIEVTTGPIGSAIPGIQTTPSFPARCVNIFSVFGGDPYLLSLSATGDIEIYRYSSGSWAIVGGPFSPAVGHVLTPLCLHTVNGTITALWTDEGPSNDGIGVSISGNGISWSTAVTEPASIGTSQGGHSIVYRGAIWFATSIGLWCYAPLSRIATLTGVLGTFLPDETIVGSVSSTTAVARSFNNPTLRMDTVSGSGFQIGETVVGGESGATGSISSITRFVNAAPDTGNDTGLGGTTGPANVLGCFARWDGLLYFLQPKTSLGPIQIYQLGPDWEAPLNVPAPQWTNQSYSGIVDAGFATIGNDSGMWSLFVNRNDELCLFYSASGSTKLAKTTSKTLPLVFTDLTNTQLPSTIASKTNLGITLYTDDRRRDNVLHNFMLRDLNALSTIVTTWDGAAGLDIIGSTSGADYMLPAAQRGQESTFTDLQPACQITLTTQTFPGRLRIDYLVRSDPARTVDILPEYSLEGDVWFPMTPGDGDSGTTGLLATPAGIPYFFNWDAFADLDGDFNNMEIRIVPRISGV